MQTPKNEIVELLLKHGPQTPTELVRRCQFTRHEERVGNILRAMLNNREAVLLPSGRYGIRGGQHERVHAA